MLPIIWLIPPSEFVSENRAVLPCVELLSSNEAEWFKNSYRPCLTASKMNFFISISSFKISSFVGRLGVVLYGISPFNTGYCSKISFACSSSIVRTAIASMSIVYEPLRSGDLFSSKVPSILTGFDNSSTNSSACSCYPHYYKMFPIFLTINVS